MYHGSDVFGTSSAHISTTTARIATISFALNSSRSDLSNEPAYTHLRCAVVAGRHDLLRHGHGPLFPIFPTSYLTHFLSVWHDLSVYGTTSITSHHTSKPHAVKTSSPPSAFPCWSLHQDRFCHTCLPHISATARWIFAQALSLCPPRPHLSNAGSYAWIGSRTSALDRLHPPHHPHS